MRIIANKLAGNSMLYAIEETLLDGSKSYQVEVTPLNTFNEQRVILVYAMSEAHACGCLKKVADALEAA